MNPPEPDVGSVSADGTTLTFTTPPHALGPVDVTVTNQQPLLPDAVGVFAVGPTSEPQTYTYIPDAVTVAPPVITSPVDGSTTTVDPPLIEGTGDAGNAVTVTDGNGEAVCAATVAADGSWSCTPAAPLGVGDRTIAATQTDTAGNESAPSAPVSFTIEAPVVIPSITGLTPVNGPETGGTVVTVTGTGFTGAIGVTFDGLAGTAFTVVSDTQITISTPVHAPGVVDVVVQSPNGASAPGQFTYTPDAVTVAPPVITSPDNGATVTDDPPLIEGTGDAGNTVTVTDGNGEVVCTATVAADGSWSCTPAAPLGVGDHTITATQTDPDGNVSAQSDPITFTIGSSAGPGVDNGSQNGGADPGTAPSSGGLASTGSPLTELGVIGLILLVLGFGLTMGTSRRRNQVVKGS